MPFQVVEEYCGQWWHYWWAGPLLYIHLVDLGEDTPLSYCEFAQPARLIYMRKHSVPVACVPLTYRVGEDRWVVAGTRVQHFYRRPDNLAEALAKAVETWPYGCRWRDLPFGGAPPGVYDVELLEEALRHMPVFRPVPEELAVDYVVWSYRYLADFLRSEFIYLTRAKRSEEKWREICPEGDPRRCYPGAVGEILYSFKEQGLTPAVDSVLFGRRFARPWGVAPVAYKTERGWSRVYYVLGHLLRAALPRIMSHEQAEWEIPRLTVDEPIDIQGPMLRKARKRRPEPLAPIAPIEEEDLPPRAQGVKGGPFAAFDLLDL